MKIIGITGKPGAGKTTLAKLVAEQENIEILHLDLLWDEIKEGKKMRLITKSMNEKHQVHRVINQKLLNQIFKSKLLSDLYFKTRRNIINSKVNKKIKKYKKSNIDTLIIEGIDLPNLDILNELEMYILVETLYHKRIERIVDRDGTVNKQIVISEEKTSQKKVVVENKRKPDYVVKNNSDIKYLKIHAKNILSPIDKEITLEKKFRLKNKFINSKRTYKRKIYKRSKYYMQKRFTKIDEEFVCENCGANVKRLGYTCRNHCPICLYSKHVDKNPGDREEECHGILEPVSIEIESKKGYVIVFRCKKCGMIRKNKAAEDDNMDLIIKLSSKQY